MKSEAGITEGGALSN